MKRSISPVRSLLAVALAMAAAPVLAQDGPYTQTVFFGDSLTDAGYFRPLLPASVRPVTGQFTTNPGFVWSQYLAEYYGTSAYANGNGQVGTNYAAGGARVGTNTTGALGPIPSLATQVTPTWPRPAAVRTPTRSTRSGAARTTCSPSPAVARIPPRRSAAR